MLSCSRLPNQPRGLRPRNASTGSAAVTRYPHSLTARETSPSPHPTSKAFPSPVSQGYILKYH